MFIRTENGNDYQYVRSLIKQVYRGADEANAVDSLRESGSLIPELSLVFEKEGEIIGHVLFSPVKIHPFDTAKTDIADNKKYWAVTLLTVSPEYKNQGIGRSLIDFGLDKAKTEGCDAVIAISSEDFYREMGFKSLYLWDVFPSFEVTDRESVIGIEFSMGAFIGGIAEFPSVFDNLYSSRAGMLSVGDV